MNPTLAAITNIRSPFHGAAKYFDYNYEAARAYAEVDKCTDLRLCRVKDRYQGWPARGKLALFGIPPAE